MFEVSGLHLIKGCLMQHKNDTETFLFTSGKVDVIQYLFYILKAQTM